MKFRMSAVGIEQIEGDPMSEFKNVLIVVSSPTYSRRALRKGVALALAMNAQVEVLVLMHDTLFGLENWQLALPSLKDIYAEETRIRIKTERLVSSLILQECGESAPVPVTLVDGPPLKEVLRCIKEHGTELVILPAHPEGGLEQRLFGKLNEEIHRKLPCSVLYIKQELLPVKQVFCLKANRVQVCEL